MYIQIHAWDLCLLKDITSNTLVFTANLSDIGVGTYWPNAVESCAHTIDLEFMLQKYIWSLRKPQRKKIPKYLLQRIILLHVSQHS